MHIELKRFIGYWTFIFLSVFLFSIPMTRDVHSADLTPIGPSGSIAHLKATYSWHAVAGAIYYHLMAKDSAGGKINQEYTSEQAGCASGEDICSVTPETEFSKGPCKWRVRSWVGDSYGAWSATITFSIK